MKLTPFGLFVRTLRLELGLTLKTMASDLGVSAAYLSSIELGDRSLTIQVGKQTMQYFAPKISADRLKGLNQAIDQTVGAVSVDEFSGDNRALVAAFARRLTEGMGVPDEVRLWIEQGGCHSGNQ